MHKDPPQPGGPTRRAGGLIWNTKHSQLIILANVLENPMTHQSEYQNRKLKSQTNAFANECQLRGSRLANTNFGFVGLLASSLVVFFTVGISPSMTGRPPGLFASSLVVHVMVYQ